MFNVYKKETDEIVDVYDARTDRAGYPMFLVFENNQWKYRSAKYFKPYVCWVRAEEDI